MKNVSSARIAPVGALMLLSLFWACGILRPVLLPNSPSGFGEDQRAPLVSQSLPLILLAGAAGSIAVIQKAKWPRGRQFLESMGIGLGMFAVPALLIQLADRWVPALTRAALLMLVPVFAVVFEPHLAGISAKPRRDALPAALLGVAGALCIFPIAVPISIEAAWGFCIVALAAASIAAANCLAVRIIVNATARSTSPMAAIAGATAASALAFASAFLGRTDLQWQSAAPQLLWSACVELPALLLLFWLMRHLSVPAMATRYLIAPLLAILIGALLLREPLVLRTWLGLLLMAAGAGWLLFAPAAQPESLAIFVKSPEE